MRCRKAFRPFGAEGALKFANAWTEFLHSSSIGFMTVPSEAWWPRYWALATVLAAAPNPGGMADQPGQGDPISAWATIYVPTEYFSCPTCHLVLDGQELIDHVGLPDTFDVIDDNPEWPEPDYGNDQSARRT